MLLRQVLEIFDLLDFSGANGKALASMLCERGAKHIDLVTLNGERGKTDCLKILIPGAYGKVSGGDSPTLGIIGRLGGIGARPEVTGFVSDGDGALAALSAGLKLVEMHEAGDVLDGDVIVATHICPDAPTLPHDPVPFMNSPIDMREMNDMEVDARMDAILSIDTTKGNRVINVNGIALSPTVMQGAILPVSNDLLDVMVRVTGKVPQVFALSQQDITPYGNGLHHLNSILQPACATSSPVVGVAIAVEQMVAGCATGASHAMDVESAARFAVEVAKDFTAGRCAFYNEVEWMRFSDLYGSFTKLQGLGD